MGFTGFGGFIPNVAADIGTRNSLIDVAGIGLITLNDSKSDPIGTESQVSTKSLPRPAAERFLLPSYVTYEKVNGQARLAIGQDAYKMLGIESADQVVSRAVQDGKIYDPRAYEDIFKELQSIAGKSMLQKMSLGKPRVVVGVPNNSTEVEVRAIEDIIQRCGGDPYAVSEAVLAAISQRERIGGRNVYVIIDIGGGTADIAIMQIINGAWRVIYHDSIAIGGDCLNLAIMKYMRKVHRLKIGLRTAEWIKVNMGSAVANHGADILAMAEIKGRRLPSHVDPENAKEEVDEVWPTAIQAITDDEIRECLQPTLYKLMSEIRRRIDGVRALQIPYYLNTHGSDLTGGSAQFAGLAQFFCHNLGFEIQPVDNPYLSVIKGAAYLRDNFDLLKKLVWQKTRQHTNNHDSE